MGDQKQALAGLSDAVWERMWRRFEGLTDEEYFWEPVPDCWSLRSGSDGRWTSDLTAVSYTHLTLPTTPY